MARRRYIDPDTGDYVVMDGAPQQDETRASEVVLRLRKRRGTGCYPWLGSRLYTLKKNAPGSLRLAEHFAYEALDDLIRSGAIRDVVCVASTVTEKGATLLAIEVEFRDTEADKRTVRYTQAFGG